MIITYNSQFWVEYFVDNVALFVYQISSKSDYVNAIKCLIVYCKEKEEREKRILGKLNG